MDLDLIPTCLEVEAPSTEEPAPLAAGAEDAPVDVSKASGPDSTGPEKSPVDVSKTSGVEEGKDSEAAATAPETAQGSPTDADELQSYPYMCFFVGVDSYTAYNLQ